MTQTAMFKIGLRSLLQGFLVLQLAALHQLHQGDFGHLRYVPQATEEEHDLLQPSTSIGKTTVLTTTNKLKTTMEI